MSLERELSELGKRLDRLEGLVARLERVLKKSTGRERRTSKSARSATAEKSNFLRMDRAAEYLGIGSTTLYSLIQAGHLPAPTKISARACGYSKKVLDSFIKKRARNY